MTEREFATEVVRQLQEAGYESYWAGGCVRDELLGLTPADHDVATAARPKEVRQVFGFRRTIEVGASFGVVEVQGRKPLSAARRSGYPPKVGGGGTVPGRGPKPLKVQVATFRHDGTYSDGRHPDEVTFSTAKEDALRRDFTINGMFFDPIENHLIDFVGGQQDLRDKILRAIGDPLQRFREDKLRMLRAVRIATRFDLTIEENTRRAIAEMANEIGVVSSERIADELRKMLIHPRRVEAIRTLQDVGLLDTIPQLDRPHQLTSDQWQHILGMLERLGENPSFPLVLATLYFYSEAKRVSRVCRELRLSNEERLRAEWLIKQRDALCEACRLPRSRLFPLLVDEHIAELLALMRVDSFARDEVPSDAEYCQQILRETPQDELDPPPLITGEDLRRMGLEPGPSFKLLLDAVRAAQLDGEISSSAEAMQLVERLLSEGTISP